MDYVTGFQHHHQNYYQSVEDQQQQPLPRNDLLLFKLLTDSIVNHEVASVIHSTRRCLQSEISLSIVEADKM